VVRGGFSEPVCGKVLTSPDWNARGQRVLGSGCGHSSQRSQSLLATPLQSLIGSEEGQNLPFPFFHSA